ncbi:MAG: EAL domain-containing protein [Candidatus Sedimenticola sp. 6PFRAG1]
MGSARENRGQNEIDLPVTDRRSWLQHVFFQHSKEKDHEQSQALARIIISFLGTLLLIHLDDGSPISSVINVQAFLLCALYFIFGSFYYLLVSRHKNRFPWRRYLIIFIDYSALTLLTYGMGDNGFASYPVYLWISVGNGLRFGPRSLAIASSVGVGSFLMATHYAGLLPTQPVVVGGLTIGLVLVPLFMVALLNRLKEANQKLHDKMLETDYQAHHDLLTGLPNRLLFETILEATIARAQRQSTQFAVAFLDLDSFKTINDSLGHPVGDRLLQQVGECLKKQLRESDIIARLGGDEFILLLEDTHDSMGPEHVMNRLKSCSERYYALGNHRNFVTWSCGIAMFPDNGTTVADLIKHADTAMYRAKAAGGSQFHFYSDEMSREVAARMELSEELRAAIDNSEFVAHYQPQIDIPTGNITGAEALMRWHHPTRGLVYPGAFIDVAEKSGLMIPMGKWILRQACKDLCNKFSRLAPGFRMSVNVSAQQFSAPEFVDELAALLEEFPGARGKLTLEITESLLIDERQQLKETMQGVKDLGVKLSLDDFGTGYSSLSYLKRFPVDYLKIDRSFINDIPGDPSDEALIETILAIGENLDIDIVAEGVENKAQYDWLLHHGCQNAQGFFMGKPMHVEQFLESLAPEREPEITGYVLAENFQG